jgi:DNA topoisomerase-6 subunit B
MHRLVARKRSYDGRVLIEVRNHTGDDLALVVYDISADTAEDARPAPDFVSDLDGEYTRVWNCALAPGEAWHVVYTGKGGGMLDVRGVEDAKKVVVYL